MFSKVQPFEMEEGGEFNPDILTGNVLRGTNNGNENVELEDGEFAQEPGGTPALVVGKTHEEGGEKLNLQGGSEVLSNDLTLSNKNVEELSKELDLKLSTKDTFAKALDKFNKSIGLNKLVEEEEEILEEVKRQKEKAAEKGADKPTTNINLEFLSSKLKDITDKKRDLEAQSSLVFEKIFEMQEDSKPKNEREIQTEFNIGGKVFSIDQIVEIGKQFGVEEDRAVDIIKKMEGGGPVEDRRKDLINQVRVLGFEGDLDPENIEQNIGEIQKFLAKEKPQAIIDFFKNGIAITAKGVDILKESNPNIFKVLGFDINKNSASFTEAERKKIQSLAANKGVVDDNFYLEQFQDGKWEFRFPQIPIKTTSNSRLDDIKNQKPTFDLNTVNVQMDLAKDNATKLNSETKEKGENEGNLNKNRQKTNALLLPENLPLPPSGLQVPLKNSRRFGRINRSALSPEARLAELQRSVQAAESQIQNLPSGQREAAILQLRANTQAQADRIIAETEQRQDSLNLNIDMFNTRQGDLQEEADAKDALDFERRVFGALANTEDDFRRFFNTVQERNIQNFNTINSLNLLNQTSENFDFGNNGVEFTGGTNLSVGALEDAIRFNQASRVSNSATNEKDEEKKQKKSQKKRRGGRVKRRL